MQLLICAVNGQQLDLGFAIPLNMQQFFSNDC